MHTSKWPGNALKILQYFGAFASVWDIMHERVKFLKVYHSSVLWLTVQMYLPLENSECSLGIVHLVRVQNEKTDISYPQIRTCTCAYQAVRKISFSKKFPYILNGWFLLREACLGPGQGPIMGLFANITCNYFRKNFHHRWRLKLVKSRKIKD